MLFKGPLAGVDGRQVTIQRITYPAGWEGGRHTHSGPVYVYVVEGTFVVDVEGRDTVTLAKGELVDEPSGPAMVAKNGSTSEPVTVLLMQVNPDGEPLTSRIN